jgi:hypothetical protein
MSKKDGEYKRGYEAGRDGTGGAYTAANFFLGETKTERAGRHQGEKDYAKFGSRDADSASTTSNTKTDRSVNSRSTSRADGGGANSHGSTFGGYSFDGFRSSGASRSRFLPEFFQSILWFVLVQFVAFGAFRFAWGFSPMAGFEIQGIGGLALTIVMFFIAAVSFFFSLPLMFFSFLLGFDPLPSF